MQVELLRTPELGRPKASWDARTAKHVMVLYPLQPERQVQMTVTCLAAAAALAVTGTSVSYRHPIIELEKVGFPSPALEAARDAESLPSVASMLLAIRKRSALTWEQLATIFAVSRRAVHHWASGSAVTAENRQKVRSLLDEAVEIGDVEPFVARSLLLDRHGVGVTATDRRAKAEPILIADQSPLAADSAVRRTPSTRLRRG